MRTAVRVRNPWPRALTCLPTSPLCAPRARVRSFHPQPAPRSGAVTLLRRTPDRAPHGSPTIPARARAVRPRPAAQMNDTHELAGAARAKILGETLGDPLL